jgi:hypothetical protein
MASCIRACVRARWRANEWESIQEERRGEASRRKAGGRTVGGGRRIAVETRGRHGAIDSETLPGQAIRQATIRQAIGNPTGGVAILEAALRAGGCEAPRDEADR